MALSIIRTLVEVATHPALLQIPPQYANETSRQYEFMREFLTKAVPAHILEGLGGIVGRSRFTDGLLSEEHSGKMIALKQLLGILCEQKREKVLVFSQWTRMLDIIEAYVKCKGSWTYRRLDGDTPQKDRQKLVDEFNSDASIVLFLLSTKAGGLGLNTQGSRVATLKSHTQRDEIYADALDPDNASHAFI
jgi:SNF2 family DNA or RNA helicase